MVLYADTLKELGVFGSGEAAAPHDVVFERLEGVEIRDSDVWFSDTYNDRIVRFRVTGP